MDLHPNLTVVSGLHGEARCRVLDALAVLPGLRSGDALQGISGLIEAHGVLLDLDAAALALLDLDADLDIVVGRAELEELQRGPADDVDAVFAAPSHSLDGARQAQRDAHATHEVLHGSLERLRETYRQAAAKRTALARSLAELGETPVPTTSAGPTASQEEHVAGGRPEPRGTTVVLDSPGPTPEAVAALASAAARVDRLRTKRDDTLAGLAPLEQIDTAPVSSALLEARRLDTDERVPNSEANGLADEFGAATAALEAYDRELEAAGLGPAAVFDRLDAAQRRLLAAEEALRPPSIDPEQARELEAAHEELQAAELRLTAARISSKNIKKRLDDAVVVEQEILARMGFATYTAFVMSTTAPSVSPEVRLELERAQVELVEADAAYTELRELHGRDPERAALVEAVDLLRSRAHSLVGRVDDGDLGKALRELTVVDEAHTAGATLAAQALREALEVVGVDFGDLDLRGDEVADVATVWLADMDDASTRRRDLEETLRELEDEIARAELDLAQLGTSAPSAITADPGTVDEGRPPGPEVESVGGDDRVDAADPAELERALVEAMATEADLEEQLDAQGALVAAAAAGVRGAADRLAVIEASQPDDADGDVSSVAAAAVERPGLEQVEWYLLAKLAAQRSVSLAGAVPLVLDDALSCLPDDEVAHLMGRLDRMTDAVQVIYLGDDPRVVEWAEGVGDGRARSVVLA